jgi:hypothetical protein
MEGATRPTGSLTGGACREHPAGVRTEAENWERIAAAMFAALGTTG